MTVKIHLKGNRPSPTMTFAAGTPMWEAIRKSLDSLEPQDVAQITVLYIYKSSSEQPIVAIGPFE